MGKIKSWVIALMVSILAAWGVQTATPKEIDEKRVDDEEHMFI
jgi:hypothetical protein